ncbi:MAG: peptidylprolyl isomerase [Planctomycetes bacterium]|nr:peptidylprolyl isomerase [Planctomycetota bacterium]MCB9903275.1 peptidylprolyl isomerase [Planctomycetota bacterium]
MPVDQLEKYWVVIVTNQGSMIAEFWPDVAPNHVRNFLDLSYTKFYDGLKFHRVVAGFMIQSGCPLGTGTGSGPRHLNAEFSQKRHVRGVLSAARLGNDINSATSQFFVVHGTAPGLDGKYSAFGKLVKGEDVLDKIATCKVQRSPSGEPSQPVEPQLLLRAVVVKAPAEKPAAGN